MSSYLLSIALAAGPTEDLRALLEEHWEHVLRENPTMASELGDRRYAKLWPKLTVADEVRRLATDRKFLARLEAIPETGLSPADRMNRNLLLGELRRSDEAFPHRWFLLPMQQREGIQTAYDLGDSIQFKSVADYEDWLTRLDTLPGQVEATIGLMRQGIAERRVHPKIVLERLPAQVGKLLTDDPKASPFYKPFLRMAPGVPTADAERLRAKAATIIAAKVTPAYRGLKSFLEAEYLPAGFDRVGAWQLPDGKALYATRARHFTTTELTPDEIHRLGMSEVARIRKRMDEVIRQVGFKGDFAAFQKYLRTDPRFYRKTPAELIATYRDVAKRIDPELVKVFRLMPRTPYGVEAIPAEIAPDTTTAYYRPPAADGSRAGTFFVNLHRPDTRPIWEMMALSLHEAVPGHHFQIAFAMEAGELPKFRRYGSNCTAYVEGWALYAESLGEEMGLYADPYDRFGKLTYEMWRAVRLVVDTGMHDQGWTRERAIRYFMDNAAKNELDVVNEIDRYIAWPGQALAYKVGELKFQELRRRAEAKRGAAFDLKAFHEVVLSTGPVPLTFLEARVDEWLAGR